MSRSIDLINQVNSVFEEAKSIEAPAKKAELLRQYADLFDELKTDLDIVLPKYILKSVPVKGADSNVISNNLKNCILGLINFADLFVPEEKYDRFMADVIGSLITYDDTFVRRLEIEDESEMLHFHADYIDTRKEFAEAIKAHNNFEGMDSSNISAEYFCSDSFESSLLIDLFKLLEKFFLSYSDEQIDEIINYLNDSNFIKEMLQEGNKIKGTYKEGLFEQYCETILKYKSIFESESVKDDPFVKKMWNGQIHGSQFECVVDAMFNYALVDMVREEDPDEEKSSMEKFAEHFKKVGVPEEEFSKIILKLLASNYSYQDCALFLSRAYVPRNHDEFVDSEFAKEHKWLANDDVFMAFTGIRDLLTAGYLPYLPAKYYIEEFKRNSDFNSLINPLVTNLMKLLRSDYYSESEKEELVEALENRGFSAREKLNNESVLSCDSDVPELKESDIIELYSSGIIIPKKDAIRLLNGTIQGSTTKMESITLQACIQSLVYNTLKAKGVDIGNRVFFGFHHNENGYYDKVNDDIWLNYSIMDLFMQSSLIFGIVRVFETLSHEMDHAIVYNNIRRGIIDFPTYCSLQERTICKYDEDYYDDHYDSIFEEYSARKEAHVGSLELVSEINPEHAGNLVEFYRQLYKNETKLFEKKKKAQNVFPIGEGMSIGVSDYLGRLIKHHPEIMEKNPIFNIEYNPDGSRKDITTLLGEFNTKHQMGDADFQDKYSIYRGIIKNLMRDAMIPDELNDEINAFMKIGENFITISDMERFARITSKGLRSEAAARVKEDCQEKEATVQSVEDVPPEEL